MAGTYLFSLVSESELGTLTKDSFPLQVTVNISRNESLEVCALLNLDAYKEPYFSDPYSYAFASFPETATNYGNVTLLITYDMVKDSLLEGDNFICLAMGYNPETVRTLITFTYTKSKDLFIGAPYKKIALTNLCPAVDGTNGFNAAAGVIESSTTYTKYSQNALKINSIEGQSEVYATSTTSLPLDPTHIYYTRIEAYQETSYGTIEMYWPIAEPRPFNLPAKEAGKWNIYSAVVDRSAFTAGDYPFRLDFNSESNNYIAMSAWYDGWMIVDLTEAFGAGNEPEAEWCDENIPYAVGDFSIELPSDGTAKKAIDMFIGIGGVAKRVKEAFIGINGIAKKVFEASPSIINFTIGGSAYQAEENMTWAKWLESNYNTDNFVISGDNVSASIGTTNMITTEDGNLVALEDIIMADYSYDVELQGAGGY